MGTTIESLGFTSYGGKMTPRSPSGPCGFSTRSGRLGRRKIRRKGGWHCEFDRNLNLNTRNFEQACFLTLDLEMFQVCSFLPYRP